MFGGRRTKKQLDDLKEEHQDLEEKFVGLQKQHERLQREAGEETNVRISHIEEEIESMNQRVEKLATDSYEIRGEVRDIHESVLGMQTSLSEIVKLYKAIITQYGFGDMKARPARPPAARARPGEDPGDSIIRALEEEQGRKAETAPSRPEGPRRGGMTASPPPKPRPAPMRSNALDELHRLSEEDKGGKDATARMEARSGKGDKVDRVAQRDLKRPSSSEMDRNGDFTRSLPRKELRSREGPGRDGPVSDAGWESVEAPGGAEKKARRPKPKLEDLLSPE